MQNPYSEDQLVEQPAIKMLKELGWHHQNCTHEFRYGDESRIGRETKSEVVLTDRLRAALEQLNPDAPEDAIDAASEELTQSRAVLNPVEANRKIYNLLKDGVKVPTTETAAETETDEAADSSQRIQLIDDAINQIHVNDETKRNFLEQARNVYKLF